MSLRQNLKLLRGGLAGEPPAAPSAATLAARGIFERSRIVTALIFLATVAAIVVISYVGVSTVNLPVLPGQLATVRVAASTSFSFVSQELTRASSEASSGGDAMLHGSAAPHGFNGSCSSPAGE